MRKRRFRIIVRPWVPRKLPYEVNEKILESKITEIFGNLDKTIYVGWKRRIVNNKKQLFYIITTGSSSSEARKNFKELKSENETFWVI